MRDFLEKCKEDYTFKIPQLLKEVRLKTHYTKWSKTVLSACLYTHLRAHET